MLFVYKSRKDHEKSHLPHPFTAYAMKPTFDVDLISKLNRENKNLFLWPCCILQTARVGFPHEITANAVKGPIKIKVKAVEVIHRKKKHMQLCEGRGNV